MKSSGNIFFTTKQPKFLLLSLKLLLTISITSTPFNIDWLANFWRWINFDWLVCFEHKHNNLILARENVSRFHLWWITSRSWNYMPPILVPSSTKRISVNTNFLNCKIKWKERFYFERLFLWYYSSQQLTREIKMWQLSKIRIKILERCQ